MAFHKDIAITIFIAMFFSFLKNGSKNGANINIDLEN
jgi:hypothetical protein